MLEKWLQGGDLNVMPLKWRISFGRFWMGGLQKILQSSYFSKLLADICNKITTVY